MKMQTCPVCNAIVKSSDRYPNYICMDCVDKAKTSEGFSVQYKNKDIGGGFVAIIDKNGMKEKSNNHICFIDSIKCYADETKFGGIVVIPSKN